MFIAVTGGPRSIGSALIRQLAPAAELTAAGPPWGPSGVVPGAGWAAGPAAEPEPRHHHPAPLPPSPGNSRPARGGGR